MSTAGRGEHDRHVHCEEGIDMGENIGNQTQKAGPGATGVNNPLDAELPDCERHSDAEAVAAERTGRTNAARDMVSGPEQGPPPGRWDSVGEPGEGLDELQGLYTADAAGQEQLPERGDEPSPASGGSASSTASTFTSPLWDQLMTLQGQTIETPKGEDFWVMAVTRGETVTVSPLDGAQEWDVRAHELEFGWQATKQGAELDGLASIRLQDAGLDSAHPEYVAGLLRAISGGQNR